MLPNSVLRIVVLSALAVAGAAGAASAQTKGKVSLVPFSDAVVAGQPFTVGVQFELVEGWHIYWKNAGDAGLPPVIKWKLPEGFTAGEPKFPVPRRHYSPGDIATNIHAGEPILLVEITPPATLGDSAVRLAADIPYLVCAENCIREEAKVSAELQVKPAGSQAVPVNEPLLKRAKRGLPLESSKHLDVAATLSSGTLKPGEKFEILLHVSIKPGLHIQSHKPSLPSLIPAEVFVEKYSGVSLEPAVYPEPKTRTDSTLGKLTEYDGKFTIRIPGAVDDDAKDLPASFGGVFGYQACDDKGNCFPPEGLAFRVAAASDKRSEAVPPASGGAIAAVPENAAPSEAALPAAVPPADTGASNAFEDFIKKSGLLGLLVGCFVYGLFINATPCVLPLLSIKVLGFVQQAHESRRRTFALGMSFGTGVVLFFVILGILATQGTNILQRPEAVIALGGIILALALSMLGVYTLQVPTAATSLEARIHTEGVLASFGKGALAPVLGFACTGPLLAGAWGWAIKQPPNVAIMAFVFAGLGMASPYMLLGANPRWLSFLPRPGDWMITFERIMGFLLLLMVVWMIHPLIDQIGPTGLEFTLVFYILIAFGCWILGRVKITMSDAQRWIHRGWATAVIVLAAGLIYGWAYPIKKGQAIAEATRKAKYQQGPVEIEGEVPWRMWSPSDVEQAVRGCKVAFVDVTAAYCTVCKVNKAVAINTPEFIDKLKDVGAVAFQADYTNGGEDITELLRRFDRAGLPLNLIYLPGRPDAPLVLDTNLSKEYLLSKLAEAAKTPCAQTASMLGSSQ